MKLVSYKFFMGSAYQTILSLGASHLSLTTVSGDKPGGYVLERVTHQKINGDPEHKDQWLGSVDGGLRHLSVNSNLREVTGLVLPAWVVLTKLIKVARIEGEGQREVVRFEAQNALPNGLDGFEWSYGILRDDGFERDVLVQAASSIFLKELLELISKYGIQPSRIDALISGELSALKRQYATVAGPSVLIDMGARSVSLIVSEGDELPFIRIFNFGGNLVTQGLVGQLGKSFAESEVLKLDWIQSPGEKQNIDELNKASEGFVTRLVNEVQRSLALYRRQGQVQNPARVLLTGGASQLPGLADFLERKTGVPTALYDPFRAIASGSDLPTTQTSRLSHVLPAAIGFAMEGGAAGSKKGNLLPRSLSSQQSLSKKKPWFFAAAVLVLLSGLVVGLKYHMQAWDMKRQVATLEAELLPLESLSQEVTQAHETYTRLLSIADAKSRILAQRQGWASFLADLQKRLNQVQDVWVESIQPEQAPRDAEGRRLRVTGSLLDRENPLSLVSSNSRGRVEVLLGSIESSPFIQSVEDRRFDTSRPGILRFDFSLVLNPENIF